MFDLDLFYTDDTYTEIAQRPSDYKFSEAINDISNDLSTFDANSEKHHITKMWQWFDTYRVWKQNGEVGEMFEQPALEEVKKRLMDHFREVFKAERAKQVSNIKVEVDGLLFDGDELSRFRMATAIITALSDDETVEWHLANNVKASVTKLQLKEALRLSGKAMEAIWFQS